MANVQQIFVFIVDKPASLFIPNSFFMQNLVYPTDAKEFMYLSLRSWKLKIFFSSVGRVAQVINNTSLKILCYNGSKLNVISITTYILYSVPKIYICSSRNHSTFGFIFSFRNKPCT